ncbi:MAG: CGNR zinc finger domain-containing protein [Ktedonobacteraceae bacterium]|nr:CGNR zinc finger domain-containing protein [Ktedonobacteraceae bacterium]
MDAACLDFINSEFRDFRGRWTRDDLLRPDWLKQFQTRWHLQTECPPDQEMLGELITLRTVLQQAVEVVTVEGQLQQRDLDMLNSVMRRSMASRCLSADDDGYRLELVPQSRDWHWVQAEIVSSFVHLLTRYDPQRLKICANTHCRWVFYDESKSRTRRYCTSDKCANLLKVRRFRRRHSSQSAS